ncbi:MAG: ATP-binding protein, partial [Candidatus Aenigmatarchaeota archaeon]
MIDLNIQNPWWMNKNSIENDEKIISALRGEKVLYSFDIKKNTILFGPRQVGKTTMLKLFIRELLHKGVNPRNIFYFSCEPINKKEELVEVLSEYDNLSHSTKGDKYIFLDEITFVKEWEIGIKYFVETLKTGLLIATGSNASSLKSGTERLPGRNIDIKFLLPLSFREFLLRFGSDALVSVLKKHSVNSLDINILYRKIIDIQPFSREIDHKLRIFFHTGGYIKAIYEFLEGNISESTYRTYVNWILGDLSKLDRRESIFQGIIRGVVSKHTSSFSLNSFSKEMEIHSHVTVSEYLELLQNLLLTNNLYQIDINKKMPLFRKDRKTYFLDPFMYSVFSGYVNGVYKPYINEDKLIEIIVCESLKRMINRQDSDKFLFFYKKNNETDFVFKDKELIGIEVKLGTADKKDF